MPSNLRADDLQRIHEQQPQVAGLGESEGGLSDRGDRGRPIIDEERPRPHGRQRFRRDRPSLRVCSEPFGALESAGHAVQRREP